MLDDDLVQISPSEESHPAGWWYVGHREIHHAAAIDQENQAIVDDLNRQVVPAGIGPNRGCCSPGHNVQPAQSIAAPDTYLAAIADFGDDELSVLIESVARADALVSEDKPVTAAGRSAHLVERTADENIAWNVADGRSNGYEAIWRASV